MIPKAVRLTREDFSKRTLRSVPFAFGSIRIVPGPPKASVVVSKKTARLAVSRNTLRRRTYSAVRHLLAAGAVRGSIIIYPDKRALEASFSEFAAELERALARC